MKLIINNKSDLPIDTVLDMVRKVLAKGEPTLSFGEKVAFNDYKGSNGNYYTCVWQPNKDSDRYTIYNENK